MEIKNILLIRLRLLGDIVLTIPTIGLIKKNYPNANIYYMVEKEFEGIGKLLPDISELIVIPRKMGIQAMLRLRKRIKAIGFDVLIDLHSGPKSSQIAFLSGIKKKIGYTVPFRSWIYDVKINRTQKKPYIHSVYNQIRLLDGIGIKVDSGNIPYYPEVTSGNFSLARPQSPGHYSLPAGHATEKVTSRLSKYGTTENTQSKTKNKKRKTKNEIVIHVGAGNEFRDWGTDNYIALSRKLIDNGYSVSLIGHGDKETQRGMEIEKEVIVNNYIARLTIAESLYLIQCSDAYFGVDSGPLHLASLSNTPIIAIYGPNVPEISGPWRKEKITILQLDMDCRPCNQRVCIYKEKNDKIKCMKNIGVDKVYEAIIKHF